MDYYLDEENFYRRLLNEYKTYKRLIIAYDFDDTIYDYHRKGRDYSAVVTLLKQWAGKAFFICVTNSGKGRNQEIRDYCFSQGIPCDAINEDSPYAAFGGRKVYCNVLLDDRAGLKMPYEALKRLLQEIDGGLDRPQFEV